MKSNPDRDSEARTGYQWQIILWCFLLALSVFWSADASILYLLLGGAAFSLFKILHARATHQPNQGDPVVEKTYEEYSPSSAWLFWQEVKDIFKKDSTSPKTPKQGKILVALVAGFIGFAFLLTLLGAFFGSDDSGDVNEYYQQALNYYNNQQYDSAAYYYRFAIDNDPGNPDLFFERGNAFLNANNFDSALVMYDQALVLNPKLQQAQYNKGYIYFNQKNYREAIDETRKILQYAPDYTDAMLLMGDSFYSQSQLDSAMRWYDGVYSNGYRSAGLCHVMAYIYDTKGNTDKAIGLYKEAIGQDSTLMEIYTRLGELVPGEEGNWYRQKAAQPN